MKSILLGILFIISLITQASKEDYISIINGHIKKSEEATTISKRGDKAIFHAVQADNIYKEQEIQDSELEQEIQLKFIGAFRLVEQPENARKHLKILLNLIVEDDQFASRSYQLNAGRLASDFMREGESDSALHYFKLANQSAQLTKIGLLESTTLNNLGLLYENQNDWETAVEYYRKAITVLSFKSEEDSVFLTSIKDNIANYYFHFQDSTAGIELLEANLQFLFKRPKRYKRVVNYGFKLYHILTQQGNWQKAEKLLLKIKPYLQFGRHDWFFKNQIKWHESNLKLLKHYNRDSELMTEYRLLDSLRSIELKREKERQAVLNATMSNYFLLSANSEIEREKEKLALAKKDGNRKTLLILILVFSFLIISLLIRSTAKRRLRAEKAERKIKEQELKLTELKNKRLSRDLFHTSNDFSDLVMQTSLKEDWVEGLIKQLEELNQTKGTLDSSKLKQIIRGLKLKSGVYDKVNLQQKGITEVNSAFFEQLDKKYPKLTKSERELCGLIRLRLDGKEIAVIRNIHPSSVRKLRHRLRKKLGITADVDLYEFIGRL